MKIVQVCPRYYPHFGGVEYCVKNISERLISRHTVAVVAADATKRPALDQVNGVTVFHEPSLHPSTAYFWAPSLKKVVNAFAPDLIHAHNYHAFPAYNVLGCKASKFIFTPYYHGEGGTWFRTVLGEFYKKPAQKVFDRADTVISVSDHEKSLLLRDFSNISDKLIQIPVGMDLSEINAAEPFVSDKTFALCIGRPEKYKNTHLVINAVNQTPPLNLCIIGGDRIGDEGSTLLVGNVSDRIKFRWLKTCSVLVNLSAKESFGITVLEALAAGKPVVLNGDCPAFQEFSGMDGVFFTSDLTPVGINQQIAAAIEHGPTKNDLSRYNWDNILSQLEEVYLE